MKFNIFDTITEDQADRAEQARQGRIEASLQLGGDYYPFSKKNFEEAVRNISDSDVDALRVSFLDAQRSGGLNYYKPSVLLEVLVKNYWKKCAEKFC